MPRHIFSYTYHGRKFSCDFFFVPEANNEDGFEFIYFFWNEQIFYELCFYYYCVFLCTCGFFFIALILFAFKPCKKKNEKLMEKLFIIMRYCFIV